MEQKKVVMLDLSATQGTTVQVDGNPDAQFTLNLSDFGIYERLSNGLEKLYDLFSSLKDTMGDIASTEEGDELGDEENPNIGDRFVDAMKDTDAQMRGVLDYIFSAPVSDVCAPDGYMFDLFEGQLRFEYIINAITKLYEDNLNAEYYKVKSRIEGKLPQYVTKKKKGKK